MVSTDGCEIQLRAGEFDTATVETDRRYGTKTVRFHKTTESAIKLMDRKPIGSVRYLSLLEITKADFDMIRKSQKAAA